MVESSDDDCHDCTNSRVDLRRIVNHEDAEKAFDEAMREQESRGYFGRMWDNITLSCSIMYEGIKNMYHSIRKL